MSLDKEGFHLLDWKNDTIFESVPKKHKKKKKSWQARGIKLVKRAPMPNHIKKFHNTRLANYKIEEDSEVVFKSDKSKTKPSAKNYIMISLGDNIYHRLTIKKYHKLLKLSKILIQFTFLAKDDYSDKAEIISETSTMIYSINDLLRFVLWERMRIDAVYEVQAKASIFTDYDFKYRIFVLLTDGATKSYKDINKFLSDYDLDLI